MLIEQIDQTIIIALIGVLGGVLPVGISYVLTKRKEIDASIREEKTKRYDGLMDVLIMLVATIGRVKPGEFETANPAIANNFITAYHRASTYASDRVLKRCNDLASDLSKKEGTDVEDLKGRIADIYEAIRLDINPKAKFSEIGLMWMVEEVQPSSQPDTEGKSGKFVK